MFTKQVQRVAQLAGARIAQSRISCAPSLVHPLHLFMPFFRVAHICLLLACVANGQSARHCLHFTALRPYNAAPALETPREPWYPRSVPDETSPPVTSLASPEPDAHRVPPVPQHRHRSVQSSAPEYKPAPAVLPPVWSPLPESPSQSAFHTHCAEP